MKVVQTFWTAGRDPRTVTGGFSDPWTHLRSWAVSSTVARAAHGRLELVADSPGARVLADDLSLPFDTVSTALDALAAPPEMWGVAKVLTYSQQSEPFVHIDADVFLAKPLPERVTRAKLCAQSLESPEEMPQFKGIYALPLQSMRAALPWLPRSIRGPGPARAAYNCGIFGGTDLAAVNTYAREALTLMTCPENVRAWLSIGATPGACGPYNVVIEQLLLYEEAFRLGVPVETLFESIAAAYEPGRAGEVGYAHLMGSKVAEPRRTSASLRAACRRVCPAQADKIDAWEHEAGGTSDDR